MSEKEKIIDKTDEIIENCKCVRCGGILERYVFGEVKCADCGKLHKTFQPVAVHKTFQPVVVPYPDVKHLTFPLTYKFGDVIGSITIDAQVIQMIEQKLLEDTPGAKRININRFAYTPRPKDTPNIDKIGIFPSYMVIYPQPKKEEND